MLLAAFVLFLFADTVNAALVVVGDYDFANNQKPAGFTENGDPTYSGGKLLLDGTGDYIQIGAPTTAVNDVVLEAIVSANAVGTFNFAASISNANKTNSGYGVLAQSGNWNALTSNVGFAGSTAHGTTPTPTVAIAYVRYGGNTSLYVDGTQYDSGGNDAAPGITDAGVLSIGAHYFDAPNGLFNGSIDRVRVSTISGTFDANDLLGPGDGTIPEPSTFALTILALLGLLACGQRRRR